MVGTADPKLIHLVGRLLQQSNNDREDLETIHNVNDINHLVQQLCHQHREYQRKNQTQLTRDVQSAVAHWQQRIKVTTSNQNSSSNTKVKKRKHRAPLTLTKSSTVDTLVDHDDNESDDDDDDERHVEEDEYDRDAIVHDAVVASAAASMTGNSLNDRLLQIRTPIKKGANTESSDCKPKNGSKKASFRIDIVDSQDEIPETFADNENDDCSQSVSTNAADNKFHKVSRDGPTNDTVESITKGQNRKRKLVRRSSSSRQDGDSKGSNLGLDGSASASSSMSFTIPVIRPTERYSDLGGMDQIITTIRQLVEYPLTRPELYRHLGVDPPRGVLLRGPPGTYVEIVAKIFGRPFYFVRCETYF